MLDFKDAAILPVAQGLKMINNDYPEYPDLVERVFKKTGITNKTMTGKELKRVTNVLNKLISGGKNQSSQASF